MKERHRLFQTRGSSPPVPPYMHQLHPFGPQPGIEPCAGLCRHSEGQPHSEGQLHRTTSNHSHAGGIRPPPCPAFLCRMPHWVSLPSKLQEPRSSIKLAGSAASQPG